MCMRRRSPGREHRYGSSAVWKGGAWIAQVAIKRSRSIEANTLTSTYQSPCLAIKQLSNRRKKTTSLFYPSPVVALWLLVELRPAAPGDEDLLRNDLHFPPTAEQGGVGGRSNCKIVGSTRVVSLSFWLRGARLLSTSGLIVSLLCFTSYHPVFSG